MSSYTHFTHDERICLQKLLSEGKSFRQIALVMGRNPSMISREVNRNRAKYPPKHKSDNKFNYHKREALKRSASKSYISQYLSFY